MNAMLPILQAGHAACCRNCAHRTPDLSHASPCDLVRWQSTRHVKPSLVADGDAVVCGDHEPMEPAAAAWQPVAPSPPSWVLPDEA